MKHTQLEQFEDMDKVDDMVFGDSYRYCAYLGGREWASALSIEEYQTLAMLIWCSENM